MKKIISELLKKSIGIDDVSIDIPKEKNHGDYSLNIAFLLAKELKKSPIKIAQELKEKIEKEDKSGLFKKVEIAGAGFINLFINDEIIINSLKKILAEKDDYGKSSNDTGKKVLIEFVSANPTGPLHIGHGRWAAIGDVIANILKSQGFGVDKEFYINNVGRQVSILIESVSSYVRGEEPSEEGYKGDYMKNIASLVKSEKPKDVNSFVLNKIIDEQKNTLASLNVAFDRWYSENVLHESGEIKKIVEKLREYEVTYEKDGALWFESTRYGDDKDRVLVREGGTPTYFAADITYHADKLKRGYHILINVWGADHHGYQKRLEAALLALKLPSHKLEIIIGQLVTLYRNGEPIRMSKRTGDLITLKEVVEEIGPDAVRFFLLMTSPDSHMDFDLELAKKKSLENPVYYVQYAYARLCNILKNSNVEIKELEFADLNLLSEDSERQLIKKLIDYPDELEECAKSLGAHHLVKYSREVASLFHSYYHECRVISEDKELTKARLCLIESTRIVLFNVLKLLGISAPERM